MKERSRDQHLPVKLVLTLESPYLFSRLAACLGGFAFVLQEYVHLCIYICKAGCMFNLVVLDS